MNEDEIKIKIDGFSELREKQKIEFAQRMSIYGFFLMDRYRAINNGTAQEVEFNVVLDEEKNKGDL